MAAKISKEFSAPTEDANWEKESSWIRISDVWAPQTRLWLEQQADVDGFNTVDSEVRMWTRSITTRMLFLATALQNTPQCSFVLYICSILGLPDIPYFTMSHPYIHLKCCEISRIFEIVNFIDHSVTITRLSAHTSSHRFINHDSSQYSFYCSLINRLFSMPQTLNTRKEISVAFQL